LHFKRVKGVVVGGRWRQSVISSTLYRPTQQVVARLLVVQPRRRVGPSSSSRHSAGGSNDVVDQGGQETPWPRGATQRATQTAPHPVRPGPAHIDRRLLTLFTASASAVAAAAAAGAIRRRCIVACRGMWADSGRSSWHTAIRRRRRRRQRLSCDSLAVVGLALSGTLR